MDHSHHHSGVSTMGHPSTPAPPQQPPATSGPHSHGGGAHSMPMTFYFGYKNVELLFAGLLIDSAAAMAVAFVAVFLLALGYEGLKRAQESLRPQCSAFSRPDGTCPEETPRQQLLSAAHLLQTALHVLQLALSYLLMLTAMTYNAYLGLALLAGAGAGYWLLGGKKAENVESRNHDVNKVELHEIGSGNSQPTGMSPTVLLPPEASRWPPSAEFDCPCTQEASAPGHCFLLDRNTHWR